MNAPRQPGPLLVVPTALALVALLVVGVTVLARRFDERPAARLDRLHALEPAIHDVANRFGLEQTPRDPDPYADLPCRPSTLLGADGTRMASWRLPGRYQDRTVYVMVYLLPEPGGSLDRAERGLAGCRGFDTSFEDAPYRYDISGVAREADVVRWRLAGSGSGQTSAGIGRLSREGQYVLYVLDLRTGAASVPASDVENVAGAVATVLREAGE